MGYIVLFTSGLLNPYYNLQLFRNSKMPLNTGNLMKIERLINENKIIFSNLTFKKNNEIFILKAPINTVLVKNAVIHKGTCISCMEPNSVNSQNTVANILAACAFDNTKYTVVTEDGNEKMMSIDGIMKIIKGNIVYSTAGYQTSDYVINYERTLPFYQEVFEKEIVEYDSIYAFNSEYMREYENLASSKISKILPEIETDDFDNYQLNISVGVCNLISESSHYQTKTPFNVTTSHPIFTTVNDEIALVLPYKPGMLNNIKYLMKCIQNATTNILSDCTFPQESIKAIDYSNSEIDIELSNEMFLESANGVDLHFNGLVYVYYLRKRLEGSTKISLSTKHSTISSEQYEIVRNHFIKLIPTLFMTKCMFEDLKFVARKYLTLESELEDLKAIDVQKKKDSEERLAAYMSSMTTASKIFLDSYDEKYKECDRKFKLDNAQLRAENMELRVTNSSLTKANEKLKERNIISNESIRSLYSQSMEYLDKNLKLSAHCRELEANLNVTNRELKDSNLTIKTLTHTNQLLKEARDQHLSDKENLIAENIRLENSVEELQGHLEILRNNEKNREHQYQQDLITIEILQKEVQIEKNRQQHLITCIQNLINRHADVIINNPESLNLLENYMSELLPSINN